MKGFFTAGMPMLEKCPLLRSKGRPFKGVHDVRETTLSVREHFSDGFNLFGSAADNGVSFA